jgi:CHAT domain-containing protein
MFIKRKRWLFAVCYSFFIQFVNAQPNKTSTSEQDILKIYEDQLTKGYMERGMSNPEIAKYIAKGKEGISSLDDFVKESELLFPNEAYSKTSILFFVFSKDTLFRFFIIPGEIKEQKAIPITKSELEQLNIDVYNALNIYNLSESRAPRQRGIQPENKKSSPDISLNKAIKNATAILLPDSFDETYKHLIVIPSFTIGAFPFQLLQPYKDSSYLIDKCSFSIAPGLLDLIAIRKRMLKRRKFEGGPDSGMKEDSLSFTLDNPLFICNPSYPTNTEYIFPDLPGAKKEITGSIPFAKTYTLLEGKYATKVNVLNSIRHCDVVYFATHGVSAEKNPLDNNFLVLGGNEDPFLTSRNIMALRDSTFSSDDKFPQLVILSACQTGLGKSMEAGITAGLARSFLISGASQVIMSLWNVDDEATAYLMNRFIYHLQNNNLFSPSEPLRLAQLDTRKKFKNPAQWASFSVFGVNY